MISFWQHYKGGIYAVLHYAKHTETMEEMVVYCSTKDVTEWWVRPRAMFEEILPDGTPRFRKISDD